MIHPDIKTFHEERFRPRIIPRTRRRFFLDRNIGDLMRETKKPASNIKKDGPNFEMEIAMPGFLKEEIQVTIVEDILTVKAEKKGIEKPSSQYILQEFDVDMMERKFRLGKGIETDKVEAEFKNGILKLTFTDVTDSKEESKRKVKVV